jgi:hypothetical protein
LPQFAEHDRRPFQAEEMPAWNEIEEASPLSLFFIRWNLPEVYIDETGEVNTYCFIRYFTDCFATVFFFLGRAPDGFFGMTQLGRSGGLKNLPRSEPQCRKTAWLFQ